VDALPSRAFETGPLGASQWPDAPLEPLAGRASEPCAELVAEPGEPPIARLAQAPADDASARSVPATHRSVRVDPGRGAYVLSGGWDDAAGGAPYAIDAQGRANPLYGPGVAEQLGYAGYPVPIVPDSWVGLFFHGVELSRAAALRPPADPDEGPDVERVVRLVNACRHP
jgi:hypothetical protein